MIPATIPRTTLFWSIQCAADMSPGIPLSTSQPMPLVMIPNTRVAMGSSSTMALFLNNSH